VRLSATTAGWQLIVPYGAVGQPVASSIRYCVLRCACGPLLNLVMLISPFSGAQ